MINNKLNLKAIILAGGKGSRLGPLTKKIPKPLLKVNNKEFIYYVIKYLKYNDIISEYNSLTSIPDLCNVIEKFCIHRHTWDYGIYNVVNPGSMSAEQIIQLMSEHGLENPNWNIVKISDLNLKAGRSNCTLSGKKLRKLCKIPALQDSLGSCIKELKKNRNGNA